MRLACSWRLHAGCEAEIGAAFYGTEGGAALRNIGGSFYDFRADSFAGTSRRMLTEPPDDWGGRAAVAFAATARRSLRFCAEADEHVATAETLDRIYASGRREMSSSG